MIDRDDILPWVDGYLDGISPICCQCGQSCYGCDGVIRLEGTAAHFECYKQRMPSFEEMKSRFSMVCLGCGQPCDGNESVISLTMSQAMHDYCLERLISRLNEVPRPIGFVPPSLTAPIVIHPGEKALSWVMTAKRRHRLLMRSAGKAAIAS